MKASLARLGAVAGVVVKAGAVKAGVVKAGVVNRGPAKARDEAEAAKGTRADPGKPRRPRGFVAVESLPILYVNMPKSGCTTIKNILHRLDSGAFLDDPLTIHRRKDLFVRAERQPEELARRLGRDPVFTFVRHPLKRAYSCFNEKIHFQTPYSFGWARLCVAADYGARFEPEPSLDQHRENFKAFLRCSFNSFRGRNRLRKDPHWCPQTMVLNNIRRWRTVDFVGRVEHFDAHMATALGLAGLACDFVTPRMNEGPAPPWRYEEVVDEESRAIGAQLFAADFRAFGYEL